MGNGFQAPNMGEHMAVYQAAKELVPKQQHDSTDALNPVVFVQREPVAA